jgi:phosphoglycolate phosphatase-like HAD superfamily hydrolase
MKNANVFVDVDLTLVDANQRPLPGAREGLRRLRDEGCHLFLWSSCGADYCRKIAQLHGLAELFEGFTAKPDIVIDDMP